MKGPLKAVLYFFVNKISGKIINHDSSYTGTIEFSDKIESINKEKNSDFENRRTRFCGS